MAYRATTADLLYYDNLMDTLPEMERESLKRAITHYHGGRRQPDAYDSDDLKNAEHRGHRRGLAEGKQLGRAEAVKEMEARKN
jgi:hypothetical protein